MPDLFEPEISTIHVACTECGTPLELATSALSVFGSGDAVLCMDCLLRQGSDAASTATVPLAQRIKLIDETVDEFAAHLRNVLVRCIKPDLTWNREYGVDDWSDPADVVAATYAPGVWYSLHKHLHRQSVASEDN